MYIHRNLEEKFLRASKFFKAVLVTGARQVGKTTMLKHLSKNRTYVSLDDTDNLSSPNGTRNSFLCAINRR